MARDDVTGASETVSQKSSALAEADVKALFYYLPDARTSWCDVWTCAVLTAVLFVGSKFLLGLYLASGAAGSAYGAVSSLVTLLLLIFYSAQIFLFGAEFTKVYAETYGSWVRPHHYAVKVERKEIELPSQDESTANGSAGGSGQP